MNNLTSSTSTTPLPENWVEKLFHRMLLAYGKKFTDQWGGAESGDLIAFWSMELAGFTGAEIARGLKAMEAKDWPPTLPEFKRLCRPPVEPLTAYYEAVAGVQARANGEFGKWAHPAIYWAAMPLSFDLGSQTYSQIRHRWEAALSEQMEKGEWLEIPQAMLTLAAPTKEPSREEAAKTLKELKVEVKTPTSQIDHKRWAKVIQRRAEKGDKSLTLVQIEFATAALTLPEAL